MAPTTRLYPQQGIVQKNSIPASASWEFPKPLFWRSKWAITHSCCTMGQEGPWDFSGTFASFKLCQTQVLPKAPVSHKIQTARYPCKSVDSAKLPSNQWFWTQLNILLFKWKTQLKTCCHKKDTNCNVLFVAQCAALLVIFGEKFLSKLTTSRFIHWDFWCDFWTFTATLATWATRKKQFAILRFKTTKRCWN